MWFCSEFCISSLSLFELRVQKYGGCGTRYHFSRAMGGMFAYLLMAQLGREKWLHFLRRYTADWEVIKSGERKRNGPLRMSWFSRPQKWLWDWEIPRILTLVSHSNFCPKIAIFSCNRDAPRSWNEAREFERPDHSCPSFGSLVHHPSFHKTISYSACWVSPHRKKWILADEGQVRVTCKSICFYSVFFITWPSHQKLHILARLSSPSLYYISFWHPPSLFNLWEIFLTRFCLRVCFLSSRSPIMRHETMMMEKKKCEEKNCE